MQKCRYVVNFLKEHGKEVYNEVRAAYIDTMNKVAAKIRVFHQDMTSRKKCLLSLFFFVHSSIDSIFLKVKWTSHQHLSTYVSKAFLKKKEEKFTISKEHKLTINCWQKAGFVWLYIQPKCTINIEESQH